MKRTLTILALAVLTLTAGCSALTGSAPATPTPDTTDGAPAAVSQGPATQSRTVAVAASGEVQTAPDRAIVQVVVTARADSVEEVRKRMAANASRMRTALQESGIDAGQVTSTRFDIGRNFRADERPDAPRFQGQHSFAVTVNDTARAGDVVVTAVENGATGVDDVRFTITPETRRDLRREALSKAVTNAREDADVIASDMGLDLAGVRTVQTGEISADPFRRQEFALAAGGDGGGGVPTSFEGGKVTVTADVSVLFNVTST